ncbi:hypothetical protein ETD83_25535 [Actinomadura soli]|uniref:Uncharacterized protein n=1 Tax=Actinomadura soli TaxID=2508997 RepID=A0A5C4J7N5_9ACTN|nr:hypothetical protein [Actinomadura soli]TMQ93472.1 hypothetical protein ETD83_25535 [Actinomadura soli]
MLVEGLADGLGELAGSLAGRVHLERQRSGLLAEGGFDCGELTQMFSAEDGVKTRDSILETPFAAGTTQRCP